MNGKDDRPQVPPRHVRVPGFMTGDEIGLGDAVKRITSTLGVRPCGGCERRAAALNQRVVLYSKGFQSNSTTTQ
jgi:hypothetical protein